MHHTAWLYTARKICVSSGASLGFHLATPAFVTEDLLRVYPLDIRLWIEQHGDQERAAISELLEPSASALSRRASDLPLHGRKGGLVRDLIADIESFRPASPGWPASIGMGGRLPSESVAGLRRNQWPLCVGLRRLLDRIALVSSK